MRTATEVFRQVEALQQRAVKAGLTLSVESGALTLSLEGEVYINGHPDLAWYFGFVAGYEHFLCHQAGITKKLGGQ